MIITKKGLVNKFICPVCGTEALYSDDDIKRIPITHGKTGLPNADEVKCPGCGCSVRLCDNYVYDLKRKKEKLLELIESTKTENNRDLCGGDYPNIDESCLKDDNLSDEAKNNLEKSKQYFDGMVWGVNHPSVEVIMKIFKIFDKHGLLKDDLCFDPEHYIRTRLINELYNENDG